MSRTRDEMRADVRELLDSKTGDPRWTDAAIDLAVNRAADTIGQMLAKNGPAYMRGTTTATITNSTATVPANNGIINVFITSGNTTFRLKRGTPGGRQLNGFPSTGTLTIDYVPKYVPPTTGSDPITYCGLNLNDFVVDQFCAYVAAKDCKTKEAEPNPLIMDGLKQLEATITSRYFNNIVAARADFVNRSWYQDSRWYEASPTTIKIFR